MLEYYSSYHNQLKEIMPLIFISISRNAHGHSNLVIKAIWNDEKVMKLIT